MKSRPPIAGLRTIHAAAITPRGKSGDIHFGPLFELIDYLSAARVGGIALFTAWGEYPALAVEERARLTYLAVKRSRVPLLTGVGSATFDHSLELAREARSAGVAAIFLPPPMYYQYEQDEILEFYTQFAAHFGPDLEIVVNGVDQETAARLSETGRFTVMDAGPRSLLTADDHLFVESRCAGLGVLSAAACAVPELAMALDAAIIANDADAISRLQALLAELLAWLDRFPVPVGVKTAVAARGIQTGPLPAPLSAGKRQCLEQFREWFLAWLPATRKIAAHV